MFLTMTDPAALKAAMLQGGTGIFLMLPLILGIAIGFAIFYKLFAWIRIKTLESWCQAIMPGLLITNVAMVVSMLMTVTSGVSYLLHGGKK